MLASRADQYRKLTLAIHTDLQGICNDLAELKISTDTVMDNTAVIKDHTTSLQDDAAIQRKRKIGKYVGVELNRNVARDTVLS